MALVGCGVEKRLEGGPACDFYTGDLFRKARAFAERRADRWYILSARHGLVRPDAVLAWYDLGMRSLSEREREVWELSVQRELRRVVAPEDRVLFLAGADYEGAVKGLPRVEKPLQGMGIGSRKQWLRLNA